MGLHRDNYPRNAEDMPGTEADPKWAVYIFQPFQATRPIYFLTENLARSFAESYVGAFGDAGHVVLIIHGLVELVVQPKKED